MLQYLISSFQIGQNSLTSNENLSVQVNAWKMSHDLLNLNK